MKPIELLEEINVTQEALLMCIQQDCSHCKYGAYKNDLYNCHYHKNVDIYNLLDSYKDYLQTLENYRNGI